MRSLIILCGFLMALSDPAIAGDFDGTRFLKVSAAEQAAVVKTADGELQLVRVGDMIGAETRIIAIEDGLVILEGPGEWAPVKYFVEVSAGQMQISHLARRPMEKHHFYGGEVKQLNDLPE